MTDDVRLDDVVAQLRALMQQEYLRGRAEATRQILAAAQSAVPSAEGPPIRRHVRDDARLFEPEGQRRRATPGLPDVLIKRVLGLRFPAGASSAEIHRMAESDQERQVSLSGVRFALDRGKAEGRYRNQNGQWFLMKAPSAETEEAP